MSDLRTITWADMLRSEVADVEALYGLRIEEALRRAEQGDRTPPVLDALHEATLLAIQLLVTTADDVGAAVALVADHARDVGVGLAGWGPRRRTIPPRIRTLVFRRDGYVCVDCGQDDVFKLTVDHKIAVHYGGSDDPDNLITRCRSCNASKGKSIR